MYAKTLFAGWADVDINLHMSGPAYLYKCFDVRLMFFAENGFPMSEFVRLKIGPVAMKDEVEYFREFRLLQEFTVKLGVSGMSSDGSRWRIVQEMLRADGAVCARITSTGGWMDLAARKLVAPPEALHTAMRSLITEADFTPLPSSLKSVPQ